jgi:hypothetical protein
MMTNEHEPVVMQILGYASGEHCEVAGAYVFSVNIQTIPDLNWLRITWDKAEALRFKDTVEAFKVFNEVLQSVPVRPDGKPNKPLTAFNLLIEPYNTEPLHMVGRKNMH